MANEGKKRDKGKKKNKKKGQEGQEEVARRR